MTNNPLIPQSKLPQLGTTIFTQMSALAQQHRAINLSQGFPDFDGPRYLQERLAYHVARGKPIRTHDRRAGLARGDCSENGTSVWLSTGCRQQYHRDGRGDGGVIRGDNRIGAQWRRSDLF